MKTVESRLATLRLITMLLLLSLWMWSPLSRTVLTGLTLTILILWVSFHPLAAFTLTTLVCCALIYASISQTALPQPLLPPAPPPAPPSASFSPHDNPLMRALTPGWSASPSGALTQAQVEDALTLLAAPGLDRTRPSLSAVDAFRAAAKNKLLALGMEAVGHLATLCSGSPEDDGDDSSVSRAELNSVLKAHVLPVSDWDSGILAKVADWPNDLPWSGLGPGAHISRPVFERACATLMVRDLHLASALVHAGIRLRASNLALPDSDVVLLGAALYREAEARCGGDHTSLDSVPRSVFANLISDLETAGESASALSSIVTLAFDRSAPAIPTMSEAAFISTTRDALALDPVLLPSLLKAVSSVIFDSDSTGHITGRSTRARGSLGFLFSEMDLSGDGLLTARETAYFLDSLSGFELDPVQLVLAMVRASWKSPRDLAAIIIPLQKHSLMLSVDTNAYYSPSSGGLSPPPPPPPSPSQQPPNNNNNNSVGNETQGVDLEDPTLTRTKLDEVFLGGVAHLAFAGRPEALLSAAGPRCVPSSDGSSTSLCSLCGKDEAELVVVFSGSPPWNVAVLKDGSMYLWLYNVTSSPMRIPISEPGLYTMYNRTDVSLLHFTQPTSNLILDSERIFTDSHCTGYVSGQVAIQSYPCPDWSLPPSEHNSVCLGTELHLGLNGTGPFAFVQSIYRPSSSSSSSSSSSLPLLSQKVVSSYANGTLAPIVADTQGVWVLSNLSDTHCACSPANLTLSVVPPPTVQIVGAPSRKACAIGPSGQTRAQDTISLSFTGVPPFVLEYSYTPHISGTTSVVVRTHSHSLRALPGTLTLHSVKDASSASCPGLIKGGNIVSVSPLDLPSATLRGALSDGTPLASDGSVVLQQGEWVLARIALTGTPPFRVELDNGRVFDNIMEDHVDFQVRSTSRVCVSSVADSSCPYGSSSGCLSLSLLPKPQAWLTLPPPSASVSPITFSGSDLAGYFDVTEWEGLGGVPCRSQAPSGGGDGGASLPGFFYPVSSSTGTDDENSLPPSMTRTVSRPGSSSGEARSCIPAGTYPGLELGWPALSLGGLRFPQPGVVRVCQDASVVAHMRGTAPFTLTYTVDGVEHVVRGLRGTTYPIPVRSDATVALVSIVDANFDGDVDADPVTLLRSSRPVVSLTDTSGDSSSSSRCPGSESSLELVLEGEDLVLPVYVRVRNSRNPRWVHEAVVYSTRHTVGVTEPGSYYVERVADANCAGDPSSPVSVSYHTPPSATLSGCGALCPDTSGVVRIDATGTGPWSVVHHFAPEGEGGAAEESTSLVFSESPHFLEVSRPGRHWISSVSDAKCAGAVSGEATCTQRRAPVLDVPQLSVCVNEPISVLMEGKPPFTLQYTLGESSSSSSESKGMERIEVNEHSHTIVPTNPGELVITSFQDAHCVGSHESFSAERVLVDPRPRATLLPVPEGGAGDGRVCPFGSWHRSVSLVVLLEGVAPFKLVYTRVGTGETFTSIATGKRHLIDVSQDGEYQLLEVHDSLCGRGDASGTARVVPAPMPRAVVSGDYVVCSGDTADISITAEGTGPWRVAYTDGTQVWQAEMTQSSMIAQVENEGYYELIGVSDANCGYCRQGRESEDWCSDFVLSRRGSSVEGG